MVGKVAREIGPFTVGPAQGAVGVVAEPAGAEKQLRTRLPCLAGLTLGPGRHSGVDEVPLFQDAHGIVDAAGLPQVTLRHEDIEANAELCQIPVDQLHHRADPGLPELLQPHVLRGRDHLSAVRRKELVSHRLEVLARIQALPRRRALGAGRHAVTVMERASELVDLAAGVVDVVLTGDGETRERQEGRSRVAEYGATPVSYMERPSRVRRHVFDIDRRRVAHPGTTVVCAGRHGRLAMPEPMPMARSAG